MVFSINRKKYSPRMSYFPKKYFVEIKPTQSLNEDLVSDTPRPQDPIIAKIQKDTTVEELGVAKPMIGEGFKVKGGTKKSKIKKIYFFKIIN